MEFENNIAIVTGASEGIGRGIAEKLASEGAKVYLVARTLSKLETARDEINLKYPSKAEIETADITDFSRIKEIIDSVYESEKRLDIFINNAGAYKPYSFDSDFEDVRSLIELNMLAPLEITSYLVNKFSRESSNKLKILTVVSQAALNVFTQGLGYGTSKTGLASGLFHIEKDMKYRGIENIEMFRIYPGTVGTEKMMELVKKDILQNPISLESVVEVVDNLLLGKTKTRDIRISYFPNSPKGVKITYLESDPDKFSLLDVIDETLM